MVHRIAVISILLAATSQAWSGDVSAVQNSSSIRWTSLAELDRALKKPVQGSLSLDDAGIEFKSEKFSQRWEYGEIKTFDLSGSQELVITDYENRHWHEPGERRFRFTLSQQMPAAVAAALTARVQRPVINGDPDPKAAVIAAIPAHRRERFGGSNGTLRIREGGIDYVVSDGRESRSWRWSDIQTLANPDPWEFRVMAYREIVEFDLKQPLSHDLFDKVWDIFYAHDLNVAVSADGRHEGHNQ